MTDEARNATARMGAMKARILNMNNLLSHKNGSKGARRVQQRVEESEASPRWWRKEEEC